MVENMVSDNTIAAIDEKLKVILASPLPLSQENKSFLLQIYLLCLFRVKAPHKTAKLYAYILKREEGAGSQIQEFQSLVPWVKILDQRPPAKPKRGESMPALPPPNIKLLELLATVKEKWRRNRQAK